MKHSGVKTANGRFSCPLQKVRVRATVLDCLAEVAVEQSYKNTGPIAIEAIYTFPLPFKAMVTGFLARVGMTEICGEIREREEARQEYEAAIRRGDSSFLLESQRPDIFQVSLGRIQPGEEVAIKLTYLEDTVEVDGELRWTLPTVVAPRYILGSPQGRRRGHGEVGPTDRVPDADLITPPVGNAPYSLDFEASLYLSRCISSVSSPSHHIGVSMVSNESVRVTLAGEGGLLDRDLVLVCKVRDEVRSHALTAGGFAHVTFVPILPEVECTKCRRDYVFLLDISGSMAGPKLEQAKKALQIALRNLEFGDRFNMVAFESNYHMFSSYPVEYNQDNLSKADSWVSQLRATGGTEIHEPLARVLQSRVDAGWERIVFLFTDGQVGNEAEIIDMVRATRNHLSLFPFGIDTAVNKLFIEGMAEAGNGIAEYVYPGERIEEKVIRQFARIHDPYLSDVVVTTGDGRAVRATPALPARLHNGEPHGFSIKHEGPLDNGSIRLTGKTGGTDYSQIIEAIPAGNARLLSLRFARERIREIENTISIASEGKEMVLREEAIKLSVEYGLLSTFTSFVAVYNRESKETGQVETVVVPVSGPHGWELEKAFTRPRPGLFQGVGVMMCYDSFCVDQLETPSFLRKRKDPTQLISESVTASMTMRPLRESGNILTYQAAAMQNADGSFGSGDVKLLKTALFVLGVLLSGEDPKPYARQLKKAGMFLVANRAIVEAVAAVLLLVHKGVVRTLPQDIAEAHQAMTDAEKKEIQDIISGDVTTVLLDHGIKPAHNAAAQLLELVTSAW